MELTMAYTVKYHGYEVACDTVDDVRALLEPSETKLVRRPSGAEPPPPFQPNGSQKIPELVRKLRTEQRGLIKIVSDAGAIERGALMNALKITNFHRLSGMLIGITKSATGCGIQSPIEVVESRLNGNGPRSYNYQIKDSVKAEVKSALTTHRLF
jgi:hypothetical protein